MFLYTFWMSLFAHAMARRTTGIAVGSWRSCATATHIRCAPRCWSPAPGGGVPWSWGTASRDTSDTSTSLWQVWTQEIGEQKMKNEWNGSFQDLYWSHTQFVKCPLCKQILVYRIMVYFCETFLWKAFAIWLQFVPDRPDGPQGAWPAWPVHPKVLQNPPTMHI